MTAPSFGQQRLWFLDRIQPGSPSYVIPLALRLTGPLDLVALQGAVDFVVARHDSLRTVFEERDGEPVQVVLESQPVVITLVSLDEAEALQRIDDEIRVPFDLRTGPLLRVLVIRLAENEHLLAITMHHIVSDGWSLSNLLRELGTCYAGKQDELPELTIQFADFAQWQRDQVAGPDGQRMLDYWVRQLQGAPPLLTLPTDRPRPAEPTFHGETYTFPLPIGLGSLSASLGATPFMVLLAAFQVLLSRYSGQDEVVVGTAVGDRSRVDAEHLIGFFINTVPLRTSLAGNPSFRDLVDRVLDLTLDGLANAELPFERIVEAVQPDRNRSHNPIFQVQINGHTTPPVLIDLPGVHSSQVDSVFTGTSKVDLTLGLDGEREAYLQYSTELFDATTIKRFAAHLTTFLTAVLADPDRRIGEVPLLAADEYQPRAEQVPVAATTALDLFAEQVAAHPEAVAVQSVDESLTFGELDVRANRMAHLLRAHGVGPDVPVALYLDRTVHMLVGLLAVWKAGGAYLPLDPSWPAERLSYMLADGGARIALVDHVVPQGIDVAIPIDLELSEPDTAPDIVIGGGDLAYLIYTSGSTGRPKGVAVPHRGVANCLTAMRKSVNLSTKDVAASVTSLSFDMSVRELLLPLVCGARILVLGSDEAMDPTTLGRRLLEFGATMLQVTPTRWRLLLAEGSLPSCVRLRMSGGEPLTGELVDELSADGAEVWNFYGPTETTMIVCAGPVSGTSTALAPSIQNTRTYVLDEALNPVPAGVVGQVYIGGIGVTRGYHRRPGMTAERFLPDPFADTEGARFYATGDLARRHHDGRMELVGRVDHQVKLRGIRIELGEIEATLREHDLIEDAVVLAWPVTAVDVRLAAYVVGPADEDLRPYLLERLPEHMIPSAFIVLDKLPQTPTGKINRAALPQPDWDELRAADRVPPRDAVERALAGMWQELLGAKDIGVHEDFFSLGGHSLLVGRLLARVSAYFQVEVALRALFDHPTVAGFAEVLRLAGPEPGFVDEVAELRAEIESLPEDQVAALLANHDIEVGTA